MTPTPAIVLTAVFLALSALHVYWALAGSTSLDGFVPTRGGRPLFEPGRLSCLAVATALFAAAVVTVWRGGYPDVAPSWVPRVGIWVLAVVFALRALGDFRTIGFFKRVRGTRFARNDTWIFSPLCAAISALAVWLALGY